MYLDIKILISYKIRTGIVTIIWLVISGGVIIAEILKTMTIANFLFLRRKFGVTSPILVRKKIRIGSSKINPEDKTEALSNPI